MVTAVISGTIILIALFLILNYGQSSSSVINTIGNQYSAAVKALMGK